jgi:hypothetical protein
MIVGNGDIASVLPNRKDLLFFASGVSNSKETRESEYQREQDLLLKQDPFKHVVYFGSLSIFYLTSRYTWHKRQMEQLVKDTFRNYTIIRLGNITWGTNPHTIINYMRNRAKNGEPLEIRDEYRYVVDKDEFLHWIDLIPEWLCEMNIPGQRMKIQEIVDKYVNLWPILPSST